MQASTDRARDTAPAILLVDGSIGIRASLAQLLRAHGYQAFEAATSDEALELLNSRLEIDALVADDQVGGSMGGLALADWVRRTRPAMHVLVISNDAHSLHDSLRSTASLTRPFHPADLLAMLPPNTPGT